MRIRTILLYITTMYLVLSVQNIFASEMIANSILDFSGTQGQNNWYYGYYTYPFDGNSFHLMQDYSEVDKAWYVNEGRYWTSLTSDGGHPNGRITGGNREPVEQWAARRWISSVNGTIIIFGLAKKGNIGGGDGTKCLILLNGEEVWNHILTYNDYNGINYMLALDVTEGSKVDFVIAPNDNDFYDTTYFSAVIITDESEYFDEDCGDFEAGKQYCINNPSACGITDRYEEGIEKGKELCREDPSTCGIDLEGENNDNSICEASFNLFTNTLHIPCLRMGESYWLDLSLIGSDPLQLELSGFGKNE